MSQEYINPSTLNSSNSLLIDELTESNDLVVLEEQLSPDEVILNADIINTERLIEESRSLEEQPSYVIDILEY